MGEDIIGQLNRLYELHQNFAYKKAADAIEARDRDNAALQAKLDRRDKEIERLRGELEAADAARRDCAALQAKLDRREAEIERLRGELADAYAMARNRADRAVALGGELGQAEQRNADLEQELATWRSVFPDVAPDRVLPDRALLEQRVADLTALLREIQSIALERRDRHVDWDGRGTNPYLDTLLAALNDIIRLAAALKAPDSSTPKEV